MARRRGIKGALGAGLGAGLSSIGETLINRENLRFQSGLIGQRQQELSHLNQREQLLAKALADPSFAQRLRTSGLLDRLGLQIPAPSPEDVLGPISTTIMQAPSEEMVPTGEDIIGQIRAGGGQVGLDPSAATGGQVGVPSPELSRLLQQARSRVEGFKRIKGEAPVTVESVGPEGVGQKEFTTQAGVQGKTFPTERPPAIEAARQGKVQFAQTAAEQAAQTTPNAIAGAAKRAGAIAGAQAEFAPPTEAQQRARGMYPAMAIAADAATQLEQRGVKFSALTQTFGDQPLTAGFFPEDQQKYLQNAQQFLNFATLILTGVTARPDEYARYLSTLYAVSGNTPDVVAQKAAARRAFLVSVKLRAERGERYGSVDEMMQAILPEITGTGAGTNATDPTSRFLRGER